MTITTIIGSDRIKLTTDSLANFATFLVRDHGFSFVEAKQEVSLVSKALNKCEIPLKPENLSKAAFVTYSRVGATKALNRTIRTKLFLTFQAAIRHATIVISH